MLSGDSPLSGILISLLSTCFHFLLSSFLSCVVSLLLPSLVHVFPAGGMPRRFERRHGWSVLSMVTNRSIEIRWSSSHKRGVPPSLASKCNRIRRHKPHEAASASHRCPELSVTKSLCKNDISILPPYLFDSFTAESAELRLPTEGGVMTRLGLRMAGAYIRRR